MPKILNPFYLIIVISSLYNSGFSQNPPQNFPTPPSGKKELVKKGENSLSYPNITPVLTMGYFKGVYSVQANDDISSVKLYMHVPVIHRQTTPVFFRLLESSPSGKILDYKTIPKGNDNWVAEVTVGQLFPGGYIVIPWECWTLKKNNSYSDMPDYLDKDSLSGLDDSLEQYLKSSEYIQSDDSKIKAKAEQLGGSEQNIIEMVNSIINFTGTTITYKSYGLQDALSTLQRGYAVCTGKANLAVALLRALGIPARVLMVAFTHYIIECYLPDYGWIRGETTQAVFPQPVENNTVMMACTQKEENYSGYGGVMCYWGTSDIRVSYDIEYSKSESNEMTYQINTGDFLILNQAVQNTKDIWHKYNTYLNFQRSPQQDDLFAQALSHQEQAVSYFGKNNIQSYLDEIKLAREKYEQIEKLASVTDRQLITELQLYQNHPNPFNNSTRISYTLSSPGPVSLKLYDIRGREIKILVNEFQSADTYSLTVNLEDLASGIYLYTLKVGKNFIKTKKMLLMR